MKILKHSIITQCFLFLAVIFTVSCSGPGSAPDSARRSAGKTAEIIVVLDGKHYEDSRVKSEIDCFFSQEYLVLPQSEPRFKLIFLPDQSFKKNDLFITHHNILFAITEQGAAQNAISYDRNRWASPQYICTLNATSDSGLIRLFRENKEQILDWFNKSEQARFDRTHGSALNKGIIKEMDKKFGFRLNVPEGFLIAKNQHNFMWLRKETQKTGIGIMVYTRETKDTTLLSSEKIIALRNATTKLHIPGPLEGTYMTIADTVYPPLYYLTSVGSHKAAEVRGLWKVEGDFMGGPFVNYTFIDSDKKRIICLDGYVYAPNAGKRDMMMQVDAILNSFSFTTKSETTKK